MQHKAADGLDSRIHNHFARLGGADAAITDGPSPDLVNAHRQWCVNDKTADSTDTDVNALA